MRYSRDVFMTQVPIVDRFVKHILLHRELKRLLTREQLALNVWSLTADAHLLQASITWCQVFGALHNRTHWRHLGANDSAALRRNFLRGLATETTLTVACWNEYWRTMINFRNRYAAHKELGNYPGPVPSFDHALEVAYYYDAWVRQIIRPDIIDDAPLSVLAERFRVTVAAELGTIAHV